MTIVYKRHRYISLPLPLLPQTPQNGKLNSTNYNPKRPILQHETARMATN